MRRRLLATLALLGALAASVFLGGAPAAEQAQADGDGPDTTVSAGINRGW
jgi:hypothetical protein